MKCLSLIAVLTMSAGPAWAWSDEWNDRGWSPTGDDYTVAVSTGPTYDSWERNQRDTLGDLLRSLGSGVQDPRSYPRNTYSAGSLAIRGVEGSVSKGIAAHQSAVDDVNSASGGSDRLNAEQREQQLRDHLENNLGVDVR